MNDCRITEKYLPPLPIMGKYPVKIAIKEKSISINPEVILSKFPQHNLIAFVQKVVSTTFKVTLHPTKLSCLPIVGLVKSPLPFWDI
jgi:hypothetical protein